MLPFVQQFWIWAGLLREMLYFMQDLTTGRGTRNFCGDSSAWKAAAHAAWKLLRTPPGIPTFTAFKANFS
ncbi:hypothetical protein P40081_25890 [Paenibacillus sp. FSL P4-0081]|uniref:hypothetical protein n=1 Tax=Paenibacillus sp. FSL P4-0081 TaxID=1536769 RepID=UPI0004F870B5|nr:hypothetical protein [Paenibacillus sp. FSL P4-0081]AIQ31213.1 hypothetical protein P40081_25890 [Paenibacillus sp. FSL P4-0081]